jgi:acyl-CoA synthetase (AMP-forming)/AMP-acid ligase II
MLLENHFELLSLYGACGYAGFTLFGVNTGLRGEVLAGVLNHARARLLIVDERCWPEVERVRDDSPSPRERAQPQRRGRCAGRRARPAPHGRRGGGAGSGAGRRRGA